MNHELYDASEYSIADGGIRNVKTRLCPPPLAPLANLSDATPSWLVFLLAVKLHLNWTTLSAGPEWSGPKPLSKLQ